MRETQDTAPPAVRHAAAARRAAVSSSRLNEDACWQVVVERRTVAEGIFFVGVLTTGVYCRTGCPSRTPLRKNVRFFVSPDEAERAGFRACKRCKPRDPVRGDVTLVQRICRRLDAADGAIPTLDALSREFGVSAFHLQRTFKRVTGVTPRGYAQSKRADRLKTALRASNGVAPAVYDAGYGSSSRAYEGAPAMLGMTPGRYGRGGEGMQIAYTVTTCAFGRMLVAATERGVSAVKFGDSEPRLKHDLHAEYPAAEIARDDARMRPWVESVLATVQGGGPAQPALPLDIRATAFRARVWEALRAIPRGETRSYGEIARAVGKPGAARAVGQACNANPVALVIPCHRVVASSGIGGYRSGVARKKKILAAEGVR